MNSGIYQIVNKTTGGKYVGSSTNLRSRKSTHFSQLRLGKHGNHFLQTAYDELGAEAVSFEVIEYSDAEDLKAIEQTHIDSGDFAYNIAKSAYCPAPMKGRFGTDHPKFGREVSAETRQKLSAIAKNRIVSDENRRKQSERLKGRNTGRDNNGYIGEFVTPWGTFSSSGLAANASNGLMPQASIYKLCLNPDVVISNLHFRKSKFLNSLPDKSAIGKTYRDLGFDFIPKL